MNKNKHVKMALAVALAAVSFFGLSAADAATVPPPSPHVNTAQVIMRDSTPLVYPYETNVVVNPTANWGLRSLTINQVAFLIVPHSYQGKRVCVLDTRAGPPFILVCEGLLGHGRKEAFHAFNDSLDLFLTVTSQLNLNQR